MIGKIKESYESKVKNGDRKAVFCTVEFTFGETRKVQYFPGAGEDTLPCPGDIAAVENSGGIYYITGIWDGKELKNSEGEKELYSRSGNGEKKAFILLDKEGNIKLNGDSKSLVTYAELNQALQNMWTLLKGHTHVVPNGTSATALDLQSASLDISKSETKSVKTGG